MINIFNVMPEHPHLSYARATELGDESRESRKNHSAIDSRLGLGNKGETSGRQFSSNSWCLSAYCRISKH